MKKIKLIALFFSFIGNAQFFESQQEAPEEEQTQDYGFAQEAPDYDQPDQGLDNNPGNPGEDPVPIDGWLYLLPVVGITLGYYFLRERRKWA